MLKNSIRQNREDCKVFLEFLWNMVYLEQDNHILVNTLMILDHARDSLAKEAEGPDLSLEGSDRVQEDSNKVGRLKRRIKRMARGHRVELFFKESPFAGIVRLSDIITAASIPGVMSGKELTNLIRGKLDLEPVTSPIKDWTPLVTQGQGQKQSQTSKPAKEDGAKDDTDE